MLIPGCGAAYEVAAFHEAGYEVIAIDFSPAAVSAAARVLGPSQRTVRLGDFFQYDFGVIRFDIIYERAFLCSLPVEIDMDTKRKMLAKADAPKINRQLPWHRPHLLQWLHDLARDHQLCAVNH